MGFCPLGCIAARRCEDRDPGAGEGIVSDPGHTAGNLDPVSIPESRKGFRFNARCRSRKGEHPVWQGQEMDRYAGGQCIRTEGDCLSFRLGALKDDIRHGIAAAEDYRSDLTDMPRNPEAAQGFAI